MRYNKSLVFLLSFLIFFISRIISFKPDPRYSQTSIIVSTKLYYAGGYINNSINSNEAFYLDLLNSFQTSSPPWTSLEEESIPVSPDHSTTILNPLNNSTIYLIGGYMVNPTTGQIDIDTLVFTFDTKGLTWNPLPTTNGSARQDIDAVVDNSGKIYIFGGRGTNTDTYYNDVNILDINTNYWKNIQATLSSPLRAGYTATLLPNGIVVYIGGWNGVNLIADLKQLQLFNTKDLSWSSVNSTGDNLSGRRFHTAVLTADNKIIIYGGEDTNNNLVSPSLAVLDTSSYNWNIPNPSNSPPSLSQHSANLYGNYMIVAFGFITNAQGSETSLNENLYLLDTTNYTWVDQFVALPSPTTSPSTTSSGYTTPTSSDPAKIPDNNKRKILIGLSVVLGSFGLVGIFGLMFYLRKKRTRGEIIRIAGEGMNDRMNPLPKQFIEH